MNLVKLIQNNIHKEVMNVEEEIKNYFNNSIKNAWLSKYYEQKVALFKDVVGLYLARGDPGILEDNAGVLYQSTQGLIRSRRKYSQFNKKLSEEEKKRLEDYSRVYKVLVDKLRVNEGLDSIITCINALNQVRETSFDKNKKFMKLCSNDYCLSLKRKEVRKIYWKFKNHLMNESAEKHSCFQVKDKLLRDVSVGLFLEEFQNGTSYESLRNKRFGTLYFIKKRIKKANEYNNKVKGRSLIKSYTKRKDLKKYFKLVKFSDAEDILRRRVERTNELIEVQILKFKRRE